MLNNSIYKIKHLYSLKSEIMPDYEVILNILRGGLNFGDFEQVQISQCERSFAQVHSRKCGIVIFVIFAIRVNK